MSDPRQPSVDGAPQLSRRQALTRVAATSAAGLAAVGTGLALSTRDPRPEQVEHRSHL